MSPISVALVFWGRKGGGRVLTDQLAAAGERLGVDVDVCLRPSRNGHQIGIFNAAVWVKERKKFVKHCEESGVKTVVFVMASPWDFYLDKSLRKKGIKVVRIIHDAEPHPGEVFPPEFWVKKLLNSADQIVVLSKYVASRLIADNPKVAPRLTVGQLPPPPLLSSRDELTRDDEIILLFAGRGKKYKGQELLQDAWPLIGDSRCKLIIAGSEHNQTIYDSRTEYIVKWLSDLELEELVRRSRIVLFPYIEASQSGLIPLAQSLGKPVVITPVGGLKEQIIEGKTGLISSDVTPESFADAANAALALTWSIPVLNEAECSEKLLKLCIGEN